MSRISQREARRLRRRVQRLEMILENQRKTWSQDYIGTEIARHQFITGAVPDVVRTARKLGHAVVVIGNDTETVRFVALQHPSEPIL